MSVEEEIAIIAIFMVTRESGKTGVSLSDRVSGRRVKEVHGNSRGNGWPQKKRNVGERLGGTTLRENVRGSTTPHVNMIPAGAEKGCCSEEDKKEMHNAVMEASKTRPAIIGNVGN